MKKIISLIFFAALVISGWSSDIFPKIPNGWVNDYADILNAREENYLNQKLGWFEDSTSTQIFIVTMNDHKDMPIEMLGAEIGEEWGVGQAGKENGMIILMYPSDKKITIQTSVC